MSVDHSQARTMPAHARRARMSPRTFARAFSNGIVDICKIDVEFAAYEVMASPGHERLRRCRLLVVEIHEDATRARARVADAIVALGFDLLPLGSDRSVYVFRNTALASAPSAAIRP